MILRWYSAWGKLSTVLAMTIRSFWKESTQISINYQICEYMHASNLLYRLGFIIFTNIQARCQVLTEGVRFGSMNNMFDRTMRQILDFLVCPNPSDVYFSLQKRGGSLQHTDILLFTYYFVCSVLDIIFMFKFAVVEYPIWISLKIIWRILKAVRLSKGSPICTFINLGGVVMISKM